MGKKSRFYDSRSSVLLFHLFVSQNRRNFSLQSSNLFWFIKILIFINKVGRVKFCYTNLFSIRRIELLMFKWKKNEFPFSYFLYARFQDILLNRLPYEQTFNEILSATLYKWIGVTKNWLMINVVSWKLDFGIYLKKHVHLVGWNLSEIVSWSKKLFNSNSIKCRRSIA